MTNQCVICGAEMPEGDQVCVYCQSDGLDAPSVGITTDPYHMGQLLICAVRYAIGRDTGIPATVAGQVQVNLQNLQTGHLEVILRDIREARHLGTYDTTTWLNLADRIDGELAGREAL